jgi:hypothetical protein
MERQAAEVEQGQVCPAAHMNMTLLLVKRWNADDVNGSMGVILVELPSIQTPVITSMSRLMSPHDDMSRLTDLDVCAHPSYWGIGIQWLWCEYTGLWILIHSLCVCCA